MKNMTPFRPQPPSNITYRAMQAEFTDLRRGYVSKSTIKRFELASARLLDYAGSSLQCQQIDKVLIAGYIRYLQRDLQLSAATVNNHTRALSPAMKYGVSKGYIPEDFTMPSGQ